MELPFNSQIRVAPADGILRSDRPKDGEVRSIDIQLQVVRQSVVELVIGGILPDVRILKLQCIQLIEELKVPFPSLRHRWIVSIEGELREQMPRHGKRAYEQ